MKPARFLIVVSAAMLVLLAFLPAAFAAEDETGTTGDGFEWIELAGGNIEITGYSGGGGNITIPDTINSLPVTSIGDNAFKNKAGIASVVIPGSVASIGNTAFRWCTQLINVTLNEGLLTIGDGAFMETAITGIEIPSSVTSIEYEAFMYCNSLENVTLNEGLLTIGNSAFFNTAITSIEIPSSVTSIGEYAFSWCYSLENVTLNEGLLTIGDGAFYDTAITSIEIPKSVSYIGEYAFSENSNLTKAVFYSRTVAFGNNMFVFTDIYSDGIYGFEGSTAQNYASDNSIPFHPIYSVSFDTDGGDSLDDEYVLTEELTEPADPVKSGFVFRGWFLDTEFSEPAVFPLSVTEDITLFAKWTELALTLSPADGQIFTGGRVDITPNVDGGTWDFDTEFLSREDNTFTGIKAGTVRVTYTIGQESAYADIVITAAVLPVTGQGDTLLWMLCGLAVLSFAAGAVFYCKRKERRI